MLLNSSSLIFISSIIGSFLQIQFKVKELLNNYIQKSSYNHNCQTRKMVKNLSSTAHQSMTQQDLSIALKALQTSFVILYNKFEIGFKLIGLMFLAYLAYRLGKLTVSEPISKKVKQIQSDIQEIQEQKQELPTRIKNISRKYINIIVFFFVVGIAAIALVYTQGIIIHNIQYYIAPFFIIPVIVLIIKTIHVSSLRSKSQKIVQKQKNIKQKVKQLNKQIGQKVQSNIRAILCREKLTSKQNAPTHICSKKDCQQLRQALKARYEVIRSLAQSALQFQWCSTCKSRKPFDELVKFQAKPMPVRDGQVTQQEDAQMKSNYLLETLQEIDKWVQDAGPCNCSKLYMEQILKSRKNSIKLLKQLNSKIQALNKAKHVNMVTSTVVRSDSKISQNSNISAGSSNSMSSMASSGRVVYSYGKRD